MAAILLSACTVVTLCVAGVKIVKITTPATADDGDTIDVSTLFEDGCFSLVSGASDTTAISADKYGDKEVTIPGSTDNEARIIVIIGN